MSEEPWANKYLCVGFTLKIHYFCLKRKNYWHFTQKTQFLMHIDFYGLNSTLGIHAYLNYFNVWSAHCDQHFFLFNFFGIFFILIVNPCKAVSVRIFCNVQPVGLGIIWLVYCESHKSMLEYRTCFIAQIQGFITLSLQKS